MLVSLEVTPPKSSPERVFRVVERAAGLVTTVNVTDTPLGRPRMPSFVLAHLIKERFNLDPVIHLKTVNMNAVALKSVLYGCNAVGLRRFLFIRGDPPVSGSAVDDLSPQLLLRWARSKFPGMSVGLAAGWPTTAEKLESKLEAEPDFMFTQVFFSYADAERFMELFERVADRVGWRPKVYFTHLVLVEENVELARSLASLIGARLSEELRGVEAGLRFVERLSGMFDGFMVSSPMNYEAAIELLRRWGGKA